MERLDLIHRKLVELALVRSELLGGRFKADIWKLTEAGKREITEEDSASL